MKSSKSKFAGIFLLVLGLIWIAQSLGLDTSISTLDDCQSYNANSAEGLSKYFNCTNKNLERIQEGRSRVVNISKQNERNIYILLGGLMTLSGIILIATSKSSKSSNLSEAQKLESDGAINPKAAASNGQKNLTGSTIAVFDGEASLSNDRYKIWLVKTYGIERNEVLGGFICNGKIFPTTDAALEHASRMHKMCLPPEATGTADILANLDSLGITLSEGRYHFKSWKFDTADEAIQFVSALKQKGVA